MITKSPSKYDGKKTGCSQGIWTTDDLKRQRRESRANMPPSMLPPPKEPTGRKAYLAKAFAFMDANPTIRDANAIMESIGLRGAGRGAHPRIRRTIQARLKTTWAVPNPIRAAQLEK